jgi:hypothetical protein
VIPCILIVAYLFTFFCLVVIVAPSSLNYRCFFFQFGMLTISIAVNFVLFYILFYCIRMKRYMTIDVKYCSFIVLQGRKRCHDSHIAIGESTLVVLV